MNDFGFIETPYRKVVNGRVTDQIDFLTGDREENFLVAQANSALRRQGQFHRGQNLHPLSRRLPGSRAGEGPLHGRFAEATRLRGRRPDSLPRAR
ncbi:MAG: hypothetical protein WDN28_11965 [Chthoniobacter sp.]